MDKDKQEALNIINKKNIHPDNWFWKSDQKKFGFGMPKKRIRNLKKDILMVQKSLENQKDFEIEQNVTNY